MKLFPTAIALVAGSMFLSGCAVSQGPGGSGTSSGIDPVTQAGIDATNAATQEQSHQDTQAAFDQISAGAAASANQ